MLDGGEVEGEGRSVEGGEAAGEMAVGFDGGECLELDERAAKTLVVGGLEELAFEARGGDFEGVVGAGDEVFDVEDDAEIGGEAGAVFVSNAGKKLDRDALGKVEGSVRCDGFGELGAVGRVFFEEDAERAVPGASGEFEVNEVEAVGGGDAVGGGADCVQLQGHS